jgi:dTDP-4-dehydrorhamnose reductase
MKVLILGAYGMLGHKLFQGLSTGFDVYGTCRDMQSNEPWSNMFPYEKLQIGVRADNVDSVQIAIRKMHPNVVINAIGLVKQLDAAKDPAQTITINSLFPHKLALMCRQMGARVIHFSTDCVFSGKKGMYTQEDVPDAEDLYGRTKYLGELNDEGCVTIRSSIIGRELGTKNGLIEWFLSNRGKVVKGYSSAIYSGFTTIEMSRIVADIIKNRPSLYGVWQIASTPTSKYDLLRLVEKKMDLRIGIEKDDSVKVNRSLDGSRYNKMTSYTAPSWDSMIEEMAKDPTPYDSYHEKV